jgi:hypothetical protein
VNELSGYVFAPLRGDIALFRGHRNGFPRSCLPPLTRDRSIASSGLITNMRSSLNLTPTGGRNQSRSSASIPHSKRGERRCDGRTCRP